MGCSTREERGEGKIWMWKLDLAGEMEAEIQNFFVNKRV